MTVRGKEENRHSRVQGLVSAMPFHLASQPTLPHSAVASVLFHSFAGEVRGHLLQTLHLPLPGRWLLRHHSLRKKPPPTPRSHWLESSGAQPSEFSIKEMLCTNALDFILSFLSCYLKTDKAVSEHAVILPCAEIHAHAVAGSC